MMTNLETAVFLVMAAIIDRYPETCELTYTERQEYYRTIIRRLQEMLPNE